MEPLAIVFVVVVVVIWVLFAPSGNVKPKPAPKPAPKLTVRNLKAAGYTFTDAEDVPEPRTDEPVPF